MDFYGYVRENGTVGVRNYVTIVSAQGAANAVVNGICSIINGVIPVVHPYGRGQIGKDDEQTIRTLAGTILNPNVFAAVIVSMEPKAAEKIYCAVKKKNNKKIEVISILDQGTIKTIEKGCRIAINMLIEASEAKRTKVDISNLVIGVNCGASDATSGIVANPVTGLVCDKVVNNSGTVIFNETAELMGAEHILTRRSSPEVGKRILEVVKEVEDYILSLGVNIHGTNPEPDNIEGGITTLEEKALGGIAKIGKYPIQDVIDYAEPPKLKGLNLMHSPPPAAESNTGFFACGAQLIIFTTGKGNPTGHVLAPVIKVTGNPRTVTTAMEKY